MGYRIRRKLREWEGVFEEAQVIQEIQRGNLSGEDEFRRNDSEPWAKLSSRPAFYDALLKRLFQEQYPVEAAEGRSGASKNDPEPRQDHQPTRREGTRTHQPPPEANKATPPDGDGTFVLNGPNGNDGKEGGTLHQADIDELFSQGSGQGAAKNTEEPNRGEAGERSLALTIPQENVALALESPLPRVALAVEPEKEKAAPRRPSKLVVISCSTILLLFFLYQFGGNGPKPAEDPSKSNPPPELYISLTDPKVKNETLEALGRQGDILYELHTPLFYAGAREVYGEALEIDESNTAILGALAETNARLYPEVGSEEGLDALVNQYVSKGRVKEPHFATFYRAEALLFLYKNELKKATEKVDFAKEVDPANLENNLVEAEILLAGNRLTESLALLDKILKEDKYNIQAHYLRASILVRQRDFEEARKESLAILKLNPLHAGSYFNLGTAAFEENRINEAEQHFATFVGLAKFAPRLDLFRAYYRLGVLQDNRGRKKEAVENFRLALYYAPEQSKTLEEKLKGAPTDNQSLQDLIGRSEYGLPYFRERAETLLLQKNYRHSLIFFQAAHQLAPADGTLLIRIGDVAEKLADNYVEFRAVSSYYERAIERDPTLTQAYIKLGLLETDLYNLERAYNLLKHAMTLAPNQPEPYIALGKYYYKSRDYISSIDQFKKAWDLNSADPETLYYAGLLRPMGKSNGEKEALSFFYRAYMLNPTYYEAMIEWLKLKVKTYDKLFAIKFVKNLIEQEPGNPNLYWAMGEVYAANKEHRRAIDHFKKALELDKYMSSVRLSMARSLEAVGELEKAVDEYLLVTRLDRRNGEGAYRAAEILLEANRFDLAERVLNELTQISPNYPGAYRYLARIYQSKKKKDQAIAFLQKEVKNNPLNAKFRLEFASMLMEYQEYEQAISELTEVTNLGNSKVAPEYALDKIRAYLLLSRCYRSTNRLESAEGAIALALDIDPNDPELHRELGYVYYGQQRSKEAAKELQYYLNRNPAASDANNIRTIIQNMVIEE